MNLIPSKTHSLDAIPSGFEPDPIVTWRASRAYSNLQIVIIGCYYICLYLGDDAKHSQRSEEETAGRHTDPEPSEAPADMLTLHLLNKNVIKCDICQNDCTVYLLNYILNKRSRGK